MSRKTVAFVVLIPAVEPSTEMIETFDGRRFVHSSAGSSVPTKEALATSIWTTTSSDSIEAGRGIGVSYSFCSLVQQAVAVQPVP
jgi:hypothetical protein